MKQTCLFVIVVAWSLAKLHAQETFQKREFYDIDETKVKTIITLQSSDSTLHGFYQSAFENGSLSVQGSYHFGVSDSTWVYYFENGQVKAKGNYQAGERFGKWEYFYESGKRRALGYYKGNIQSNLWTYYFENENEKSKGAYLDGFKNGIWNYFYEDGSLKAQAYFNKGKGTYKEFYPNGNIKHEGNNEFDKSQGEWVYYYESGAIEALGTFENGLREGFWTYNHENGQVAGEGFFSRGEKSGIWKYYFPDGSVSSQGEMIQGQKDGFWKLYYETGEIKGEGKYDKGSGEFAEYYASGKQKARGEIKQGQREGEWQYFNEEGIQDGLAVFDNGVGEYVGKYPDGTLKMTGTIENDRRTGKWTLYNPDSTVAGIYRPVYEEQQPIFRATTLKRDYQKKQQPDKPEYKYRNKKLRYFDSKINEYTGWIAGTNPLAVFYGELPIAVEYYKQERLGHELQFTFLRAPFFTSNTAANELSTTGFNIDIKQKFYHEDTQIGMLYFGHQIRGGFSKHKAKVIDSLATIPVNREVEARELRLGYGLFIGNRWMQRVGDSGVTIDFNIGIMIGQRAFDKKFDASFFSIFDELNQENFYLPVLFTLHIGYVGPKRRRTSF